MKKKDEVITFKAEPELAEFLRTIPNKSAFIRSAVLSAVNNLCPVCCGAGTLTIEQRRHWDEFLQNHSLTECNKCEAVHLVCQAETPKEHKEIHGK